MKRQLLAITGALAVALLASVAFAGDDVTSLSYISYLERYTTIRPAQGGESLDAVVNMPVLAGDRLDTSRGARVELQLADGSTVWVDQFSTLDFDALAFSRDDSSPRTVLYLVEGGAVVEIPATTAGDGTMRFDSPSGTVYLNRPGLYRLELHGNEVRVQAFSGLAELPQGVGSAILRGGEEASLDGSGELRKASISDSTDDFWNWVQDRRHPLPSSRTAQVVDTRNAGRAAVLDSYGDWVYVGSFSSWMWRPRVSVGWVPYSSGRWYWTPVGWSWISYEPWGWVPFHYGSWYLDASFGWVWGWDPVWSPAWVYWMYSPGYVGWCPRGYYDWWYYNQCTHCWGTGWLHPGRWSEVAFDFSGRVRLSGIDPRPWTFVSTGQFTTSHLERVRLEPTRFLRGQPEDRTGLVRSGPLVTPVTGRGLPDRGIDSFFRGTTNREVPDLSSIMRREPLDGDRLTAGVPGVRPTRTNELVTIPRLQVRGAPSGAATRDGAVDRSGRGAPTGGSTERVTPGDRTPIRPYVDRGRTGRDGAAPPAGRPDAGPRSVPVREVSPPAARDSGRVRDAGSVRESGRSREVGASPTAGTSSGGRVSPPPSSSSPPPPPPSSSSAPPPPPPQPDRPPSREQASTVRERAPSRWQEDPRGTGEQRAVTVMRRHIGEPGSARVSTAAPWRTSGGVYGYRASPRDEVRSSTAQRAPVAEMRRQVTESGSARVVTAQPWGRSRGGDSYQATPREVYRSTSAQPALPNVSRRAAGPGYAPYAGSSASPGYAPHASSSPSAGYAAHASSPQTSTAHSAPPPSRTGSSRRDH